jgi:hypothetical protein
MGFPYRSPRLARDARFLARDRNTEQAISDPDRVLERISKTLRRRLSDRIEAVFQAACMTGELDTAADLLTVLGNVRERGRRVCGNWRCAGNRGAIKRLPSPVGKKATLHVKRRPLRLQLNELSLEHLRGGLGWRRGAQVGEGMRLRHRAPGAPGPGGDHLV